MKPIHAVPLLGAALLAACSERPIATAPAAGTTASIQQVLIGDRSYTWSFSCGGKSTIGARWYWAANGDSIPGSGVTAYCDPRSTDKVSGTGVRPSNANGLFAQVSFATYAPQFWTFDPSQPFSVQAKGSYDDCYLYHFRQIRCDHVWGLLSVDS